MKAKVKRKEFLSVLSKVNLVIPRYAHLLCGSYLIRGDENKLIVVNTNLEQFLIRSCRAVTEGEGEISVNYEPLVKFLKALDDEEVILIIDKNKFIVQASNALLTLEGWAGEHFPLIPQVKGREIKVSGFSNGLKEIAYACSTRKEDQKIYRGVYFTPLEDKIELVATDGFRLAATLLEANEKLPYQFILPVGAVKIAIQLKMEEVAIKIDEEKSYGSLIGDENVVLMSPLLREKYPDYKHFLIVPKESFTLKVNVRELRRALTIASKVTIRALGVTFRAENAELVLSADIRHRVEVRIKAEGKIAPIILNPNFLKDILDRVAGEVTIKTTKSDLPLHVPYKKTTHVMMPIKV